MFNSNIIGLDVAMFTNSYCDWLGNVYQLQCKLIGPMVNAYMRLLACQYKNTSQFAILH